MRRVLLACCAGIFVVALLAGCGSAAQPPPLTVSCAIHKLSNGLIRVSVTVKNTTSTATTAYLYGPPLTHITHIYPPLAPGPVTVSVSGKSRSYVGFLVPHLTPAKPVHVVVRLAPPIRGESLVASPSQLVKAADWSVLNNSDCVL